MHARTFKTEGIVLKRINIGEADRLVTIFTKAEGKLVARARGVRKITSRRAGSLEPATQANFFFRQNGFGAELEQAQLIHSFSRARTTLRRLTQVSQILEIVDLLTRENQSHESVYSLLVATLEKLNHPGPKRQILVHNCRAIVAELGFGLPPVDTELALKHHIEEIIDRALRTKPMLALAPLD
ncbi:MAG: DNA repair protein RecO [Candidatus Chisholmbacteria bacterium]|nr:DNA repair protein RecO [Candidatus Chisholmbacteria bacterium]